MSALGPLVRIFRQMPIAQTIRRFSPVLVALVLSALLAPSAAAKHTPLAPPGNSGIGQYVEIIPTASGSRPTRTIHRQGGARGSAAAGVGQGGGPGGNSGVSGATAHALSADGPAGTAAANLAQATAPPRVTAQHRHVLVRVFPPSAPVSGAPSPVRSVLGALAGSSSSGGLGLLLPVLLILALLGAGALALARHRRTT